MVEVVTAYWARPESLPNMPCQSPKLKKVPGVVSSVKSMSGEKSRA